MRCLHTTVNLVALALVSTWKNIDEILSLYFVFVFVYYIDLMMFSLEKPELGAGTMYAPAGTTFTKQTSATLKMSNIANIRKNRVGEGVLEDALAKD